MLKSRLQTTMEASCSLAWMGICISSLGMVEKQVIHLESMEMHRTSKQLHLFDCRASQRHQTVP